MTQEEYEDLLASSEVFKTLDKKLQNTILTAEGMNKQKYEKVFTDERDAILKAKKTLLEKNEEIVKNFNEEVKKDKKDFLKESEKKLRTNEEKEAEDLLNTI